MLQIIVFPKRIITGHLLGYPLSLDKAEMYSQDWSFQMYLSLSSDLNIIVCSRRCIRFFLPVDAY